MSAPDSTTTQHLRTHEDFELFCQIGSPANLLSTGPSGESVEMRSNYSSDQIWFANNSAATLIRIVKLFPSEKLCDAEALEELYKTIAEYRRSIYVNGCLKDRTDLTLGNMISMKYEKSSKIDPSSTKLEATKNYKKYHVISEESELNCLTLSHLTKILGCEEESDKSITLGKLGAYNIHDMGIYRTDSYSDEINSSRIKRVDDITTLALQKALETEDKTESLGYAFVFGILRGYNVRSYVGACFAMEMSMRHIFALKGWKQFRKAPGTYLDIEACLLKDDDENFYSSVDQFVNKEVTDYLASVGEAESAAAASTSSKPPLFDHPHEIENIDQAFTQYLIDSKRYREEDVPAIFLCDITNLNRVIDNRDGDFLIILNGFLATLDDEKLDSIRDGFKEVNHEGLLALLKDSNLDLETLENLATPSETFKVSEVLQPTSAAIDSRGAKK